MQIGDVRANAKVIWRRPGKKPILCVVLGLGVSTNVRVREIANGKTRFAPVDELEPTPANSNSRARPVKRGFAMEIQFVVREVRKQIEVTWRIEDVSTLTDFIYWAFSRGARYQLRVVKERPFVVELVPESGAVGEYSHGLWWDYEHGAVYRLCDVGLHYATQHGLDGMPRQVFDALDRDAQIVRVEIPSGGLFAMSLNEWYDYAVSGRNGRRLSAFGSARPAQQPQGAVAPDAHLEESYELRVSGPGED